jgi:hypothetical protein
MPNKFLVAVHGIGDQVRGTTIQLVARRLCKYCNVPANIPLGRFNAALFMAPWEAPPPRPLAFPADPPFPAPPDGIFFAEAYWADICREAVKKGYTLEEAKRWAHTVVERVQTFPGAALYSPETYRLAKSVLDEMIDGVHLLENVLYLAEKAHILKFNLARLLDDYLGDVQFVTDFENYRSHILDRFRAVMADIAGHHPEGEIYVIAHSEGTVIAFLAMLEALRRPPGPAGQPDWVAQIRGFMTFGSPIDKHLMLWPRLWEGLHHPTRSAPDAAQRIKWRNYYELGDPIGFRLTETRTWLRDNGWNGFFEFDAQHDMGLAHYYFPGKAHDDYWEDPGVFGHFFEKVVQPPALPAPHPAPQHYDPPGRRFWPSVISTVVPYVVAAAILFLGVYFLYTGVVRYTLPFNERAYETWWNILALTFLLAGVTAVVRIPRLTKKWSWRLGGWLFFAASIGVFPFALTPAAKDRMGAVCLPIKNHVFTGTGPALAYLDDVARRCPWTAGAHVSGATLAVLLVILAGVLLVSLIGFLWPRCGPYPLVILGCLFIGGVLTIRLFDRSVYDNFQTAQKIVAASSKLSGPLLDRAAMDLVNLYTTSEFSGHADGSAKQSFLDFAVANVKAVLQDQNKDYAGAIAAAQALADAQAKARAGRQDHQAKKAPAAEAECCSEIPAVDRPIWPLILGGLAFFFLWRLAAVFFDLVVVWHYYIRSSAILDRLNRLRRGLSFIREGD